MFQNPLWPYSYVVIAFKDDVRKASYNAKNAFSAFSYAWHLMRALDIDIPKPINRVDIVRSMTGVPSEYVLTLRVVNDGASWRFVCIDRDFARAAQITVPTDVPSCRSVGVYQKNPSEAAYLKRATAIFVRTAVNAARDPVTKRIDPARARNILSDLGAQFDQAVNNYTHDPDDEDSADVAEMLGAAYETLSGVLACEMNRPRR